jgi:2-oxoisovalerate dehydrogenase E2 component (dihydrolipoyl transacylase)
VVEPVAVEAPGPARVAAAPAVRARAAELGIDLATVAGSGPDGRVLHGDLDRLLLARPAPRAPATTDAAGAADAVDAVDAVEFQPVRGLRRRIAERLTRAWTEIPHITYVESVDATELEELRRALGRPAAGGPRLTPLAFVVRAIVLACADQPRMNATYDSATEMLAVHRAVHVGIATQTPDGLVVPVLRHAERRGLLDIAHEITAITSAARTGRAGRHELTGSTITITSLGALGGLMTTPIINQPEVAIIGVNRLETRPVWRNGGWEPRQVFNLSSSFDHRIVDGHDAATFVQRIRSLLETPALLFLDQHG